MPGGRPTKYDPKYCDEIIRFFDVQPYQIIDGKRVANDLPFLIDFAMKIGVCDDTIVEWAKVHPEFSAAYKKAKKMAERMWAINSAYGLYQSPFTIFLGKNVFKWTDKQDIDVTDLRTVQAILSALPQDMRTEVEEAIKEKTK